ncbi:hypothetical protein M8C21_025116, partial [Ambrosia artemisiifolia]
VKTVSVVVKERACAHNGWPKDLEVTFSGGSGVGTGATSSGYMFDTKGLKSIVQEVSGGIKV